MGVEHNLPGINDVVTRGLETQDGVLSLLRDDFNLLRRFGAAELVSEAGTASTYRLRAAADELVALVEGEARLLLVDMRALSPSYQVRMELPLVADQPQIVLIPFGVASVWRAAAPVKFIRFMTHMVGDDERDIAVQLSAEDLKLRAPDE